MVLLRITGVFYLFGGFMRYTLFILIFCTNCTHAPSDAKGADNFFKAYPENTTPYTPHGRDVVARACVGLSELLNSEEEDVTYFYDKADAEYAELNCDVFLPKGALQPDGTIK